MRIIATAIILLTLLSIVVANGLGRFNGIESLRQFLMAATAQPGDDGIGPVPSNAARYRLDFRVRVDGKIETASSVYQIRMHPGGGEGMRMTHFLRVVTRLIGEAAILELPGRPTMVVLMKTRTADGFTDMLFDACGMRYESEEGAEGFIQKVSAFRGTCPIDQDLLPTVVSITNLRDGHTIALADVRNLGANFGHGVEFVGASVTTTSESISTGIVKKLPWLNEITDLASARRNFPEELQFAINKADFVRKGR